VHWIFSKSCHYWGFFLEIFWEFFENSLEILWEFFENSLGIDMFLKILSQWRLEVREASSSHFKKEIYFGG
jgi:hypothetical protein